MAGLPLEEAKIKFSELVCPHLSIDKRPTHRVAADITRGPYPRASIYSQARVRRRARKLSRAVISLTCSPYPQIVMNHESTKDMPRFDVQLLFDEIGVILDDNQYRDAISLLDMYHVYMRQHQVCRRSGLRGRER